MDSWLDRIEPRVISQWMAYDRVEPFGHPLLKQWHEWGRQIASLLVSAAAQTAIDPEEMPQIAFPEPPEIDPEDEPLAPMLDSWEPSGPTAEDILRDYAEQQMFR